MLIDSIESENHVIEQSKCVIFTSNIRFSVETSAASMNAKCQNDRLTCWYYTAHYQHWPSCERIHLRSFDLEAKPCYYFCFECIWQKDGWCDSGSAKWLIENHTFVILNVGFLSCLTHCKIQYECVECLIRAFFTSENHGMSRDWIHRVSNSPVGGHVKLNIVNSIKRW